MSGRQIAKIDYFPIAAWKRAAKRLVEPAARGGLRQL
jgi:hypothetical protein